MSGAERKPGGPVLSCTLWSDNSELIADAVRLGYLKPGDYVLDPTFGDGNWWNDWSPIRMVRHDLYKLDGVDFRDLPEDDSTFDAVAFDPPYVAMGGRKTEDEGVRDMMRAFGMRSAPSTPAGLQEMIDEGLEELVRVCIPRGIILVKCQNYVSSGSIWPGPMKVHAKAEELGLKFVDQFVHARKAGGPQPKNRTRRVGYDDDGNEIREASKQHHTRSNWSTLLVYRTPRKPKGKT